jgi:hypothetical protein
MIDLRPTLLSKSDQLNADDLVGGPMTVTITDVRLLEAADQPVAIHWEGGEGRPFKPCKSMRRVMAKIWGEDGKAFVGQRMTLYRDDKVRFGSDAVGGIRISHMSGIDREQTMALMVTRGKRAPYTVRPLAPQLATTTQVDLRAVLTAGRSAAAKGSAFLAAWWKGLTGAQQRAAKETLDGELKAAAAKADEAAFETDTPSDAGSTQAGDQGERPGVGDEPTSVDGPAAQTLDDEFPGDRPASSSTAKAPDEPNKPSGEGGLTLAQRVEAFKVRCTEAPTSIKLQSIGRAAEALRRELDAKDPETLAELDQWFADRLTGLEEIEREAARK